MNIYDFYITPEEYDIAEKNGIRKELLEVRIRTLGWNKEKAMNKKAITFKRLPKEWIKIAESNGICYSTFKYRVNWLRWDIEIAATRPLQNRSKQAKRAYESSRKYPQYYKNLAAKNGINERTFYNRLKSGWSLGDAATISTMTRREIGLLTKNKRNNFVFHSNITRGINIGKI